ncbi:MAG: hypothetical protein FJX89_02880 [Bacteroidetes bacterium]|nr:hypothetical protein [Bacteroidota bacterium]
MKEILTGDQFRWHTPAVLEKESNAKLAVPDTDGTARKSFRWTWVVGVDIIQNQGVADDVMRRAEERGWNNLGEMN